MTEKIAAPHTDERELGLVGLDELIRSRCAAAVMSDFQDPQRR